MFYGVIHEFFGKKKDKEENNNSDSENLRSQMEKFKQLNDKYKEAIKPREAN